jgi:hypothetical protein
MNDSNDVQTYIKDLTKKILNIKLVVGLILVIISAYIAIQIVTIIIQILLKPDDVPFFAFMHRIILEGVFFKTNNGEFIISETIYSYSVAVIILMIAASVTTKFLRLGISLINVETKNLVNELINDWKETRRMQREAALNGNVET